MKKQVVSFEVTKLLRKLGLLLGIILLIMVLLLSISLYNNRGKNTIVVEDNSNRRDWVEDSINMTRVNSISELTLKQLKSFQSQDSIIRELILTVDKYRKELKRGGSVTNFNTITYITDSVKTIVERGKTLIKNDTVFIYPIYTSNIKNKWYKGRVISNYDKSYLDSFEVLNDFQIVQGTEKYGFLNLKNKQFVQVNSLNPYSKVGDIRTYITPKKTKRIVLSVGVYGGISNEIKRNYGVGLFLGYKLIEL